VPAGRILEQELSAAEAAEQVMDEETVTCGYYMEGGELRKEMLKDMLDAEALPAAA